MFKPLTQQLSERVEAQSPRMDADLVARSLGFGSVVHVAQPEPEFEMLSSVAPEQTAAERDTALSVLASLIKSKPQTEALAERKQWLIAQLTPLLTELDEFVNCVEQKRKKLLTDGLSKIREQCREQQKIYDRESQNLRAAELYLHQVAAKQEEASSALREMRGLEKSGKHVPKWASEKEIAAWKLRFKEAQQRVTHMNQIAAEAVAERNAISLRIEPAQRELERLANEETRLRHELDGRLFYDGELGLSSRIAGHVTA